MTVHGSSHADLVTYEARFFFKINLCDNIVKQMLVAHTAHTVSGSSLTFYFKKLKAT